MPAIIKVAAAVIALYGVISIAGGVIGYAETSRKGKPSVASIAAGGTCGVVLLVCAGLMLRRPLWPSIVAIVVAVALLGRFLPKVIHGQPAASEATAVEMQDGLHRAAKAVPLAMVAGGGLTVLFAAIALVMRTDSEVPS